jgi:hypothetical protein
MKTPTASLHVHWKIIIAALIFPICAPGVPIEVSINYEHQTNEIVLAWDATPGRSYNILSTDQFEPSSWGPLIAAPIIANTDRITFREPKLVNSRFYKVEELAPSISVTLVGISEQAWQASDVWVPATQAHTVSASKALIAFGAWWGNGLGTPLPVDVNGTFLAAVNPTTSGAPLRVQVSYQTDAATGIHTITPPDLSPTGDGFFLLVEAHGLAAASAVRDVGYTRDIHPFYGPGDPNTIESISVKTNQTYAQVGDLAVAIFAMDNNSNPDINISLPPGWTSIGFNDAVVDNIGYRACYKIVTVPGQQIVTCNWTDGSTFVAEAAIVVFKKADQ